MQEDFKYQGKVYYFIDSDSKGSCNGCAFASYEMSGDSCNSSTVVKDCTKERIIWIEKK